MADYFIRDRLLASTSYPYYRDNQEAGYNYAFLCPKCGDVWGRVIQNPALAWYTLSVHCAKHPSALWNDLDTAGSFLCLTQRNLGFLPLEVLQYELQLRLARI